MNGYIDSCGEPLSRGDYVRYRTWRDELFQVKSLQFPSDAIICNVLPGGRLGTSTVPCRELTRAVNNPREDIHPDWWDDAPFPAEPLDGTVLPCGCFIHRRHLNAVLCPHHLIKVNGG